MKGNYLTLTLHIAIKTIHTHVFKAFPNSLAAWQVVLPALPIVFSQQTDTYAVALWKTSESLLAMESLLQGVINEAKPRFGNGAHGQTQKREWLASRLALSSLLSPGLHSLYRKPSGGMALQGSQLHISLSHTKGYAAAIVSAVACGVDVEIPTDRIMRLAHRFTGHDEQWACTPHLLHMLWGAKETLFKIHEKGNVTFMKDLCVDEPIEKKEWFGHIRMQPNGTKCVLHHCQVDDALLVWGFPYQP